VRVNVDRLLRGETSFSLGSVLRFRRLHGRGMATEQGQAATAATAVMRLADGNTSNVK